MILCLSTLRRSAFRIMSKAGAVRKQPSLPAERRLPHPSPLPLGEGARSPASRLSERFDFIARGRPFSLSRRERVGVRENGLVLAIAYKLTESLLALSAAVPFVAATELRGLQISTTTPFTATTALPSVTDARLQFLVN